MFAELCNMAGGVGRFQVVLGGSLRGEYAIGCCLVGCCIVHPNTIDNACVRILAVHSQPGVCGKEV